ncbi:MAG TPA: hypothetical protein VG796_09795 [Verrucomicrobiales bacterium]|nr:hypothetical protein [Verrucomicrobiales bacterium]
MKYTAAWTLHAVLTSLLSLSPALAGNVRKLIEFGHDEPDTKFLREHAEEMARTPFDGCVFHVMAQKPGGGSEHFMWECWGTRAFEETAVAAAREDLRAVRGRGLKHNFLRINVVPGFIDWFDDYGAIVKNVRLAASLAREGGCDGILFDTEQYAGQQGGAAAHDIFGYANQKDAKTKSWEEYAGRARKRGTEVMAAMQEGFPELTVLLTFGHSLPKYQMAKGNKPLSAVSYGLLAPFLDGMIDAATGGTRIVDGYELSYGFKERAQFEEARREMLNESLEIAGNPYKFRKTVSCGFGLWMDRNSHTIPWSPENFAPHWFQPHEFEASLRNARALTDEYVWIYTEKPRWWTAAGKPEALPAAYERAVRRGWNGEPHHVWIEAEWMGPLHGANFSYQKLEATQKGSWAIAGPAVADSWTQGGESEWSQIAARPDEPGEVTAGRDVEIPAAAGYTLWVRYADYRQREEKFGVRITQGGRKTEHFFGVAPHVDELDPMKLYWEWSFAWDTARVPLEAGMARVEVFTTGPTQARRVVDCLCLTTDASYHPRGREKPDFAAWKTLRRIREGRSAEPLAPVVPFTLPDAWRIAKKPPVFIWNTGKPWQDALAQSPPFEHPFGVDPPLVKDFLAAHRDKAPAIFSEALSGPVWHVPEYPKVFAPNSPLLAWLDRHPDRPFGMLLNYGEPGWPADVKPDTKNAAEAALRKYGDRFAGWVSGESIAHADYDSKKLEARVRAAKSRADVLAALREVHTESVVKKYSGFFGRTVSAEEAWAKNISCLSANMEAFAHALPAWGEKFPGHENTGNSPTLARRVAFMRGAARQVGCGFADYQSCNLGDSATMFSRESYFFPASSRYILDNSYYAFSGAGVTWLWKDYVLFHFGGVSTFYNEQGIDLFWKPGGNAAGDDAPVQLSPKGKIVEAAMRLARDHARGTQVTPVAFLLDEAHGWSQERFEPGAFALTPSWNPAVLTPGKHEAALRGWFDVAYFPAPETQNRPAFGGAQTFANGIFGDIFDVIVTAPGHAAILPSYRVVIMAGEVTLSAEWGRALNEYVQRGGTLVVCDASVSGPGAAELALPAMGDQTVTADSFVWQKETVATQIFRARPVTAAAGDKVLATADGRAVATMISRGSGRLITVGVPLGLGVDDRPVPLLGLLMQGLTEGLLPVKARGDVEWLVNRLDDGRWIVTLLNNAGIDKPQHGITPTRHEEERRVELSVAFKVRGARELITDTAIEWTASPFISVPAGAVRVLLLDPAP